MKEFCNILNNNCHINDQIVNEFVCVDFDPVVDVELLKTNLM